MKQSPESGLFSPAAIANSLAKAAADYPVLRTLHPQRSTNAVPQEKKEIKYKKHNLIKKGVPPPRSPEELFRALQARLRAVHPKVTKKEALRLFSDWWTEPVVPPGRISPNKATNKKLALYDEFLVGVGSKEKAIESTVRKLVKNGSRVGVKNVRRSVERIVERYRPDD